MKHRIVGLLVTAFCLAACQRSSVPFSMADGGTSAPPGAANRWVAARGCDPTTDPTCVAASGMASAASGADGSADKAREAAENDARRRFERGVEAYDRHDFESARFAFAQAYVVMPRPSILHNLAFAELYSGHLLEALSHFQELLKDPSAPPADKDRARRGLEEAMKKTGQYAVTVTPGATLTVDGTRPREMPPSHVHVMPGRHVLEATLEGKTKSVTSEAKSGETTNVDLSFDHESPVPPPASAPVKTPPPRPVVSLMPRAGSSATAGM